MHPFRHKVEPYHGEDGFGDVEDREQLLEDYGGNIKISAEHGVAAIVRLAKEYYGSFVGSYANVTVKILQLYNIFRSTHYPCSRTPHQPRYGRSH